MQSIVCRIKLKHLKKWNKAHRITKDTRSASRMTVIVLNTFLWWPSKSFWGDPVCRWCWALRPPAVTKQGGQHRDSEISKRLVNLYSSLSRFSTGFHQISSPLVPLQLLFHSLQDRMSTLCFLMLPSSLCLFFGRHNMRDCLWGFLSCPVPTVG